MFRRTLLVLGIVALLGVVRAATAQYGGGSGSGGSGGSGGTTPHVATSGTYTLTKLVADTAGVAAGVDPNLVNAWGLVAGPSTPWWVNNNRTNTSTLYDATGAVIPLVVAVAGGPTGIVFNGGNGFMVSDGTHSGPAMFIFSTQSGVISGWNLAVPPPVSTQALAGVDRSGVGAVYKGLAIASTPGGDRLYATDFHNARIDVFDGSFNLVSTPGAFVDEKIPRRYAPHGIQNINGAIFVTYAKQDKAKMNDVPGAGLGIVDVFDTSGNFMARVASKSALNAPWGLALAPSDFGPFGGDLLVGNFGNGRINAFNPSTGALVGQMRRLSGGPVVIPGLWALMFGNGNAAKTNELLFSAGPDGESNGLLGKIVANS